MKKIIFVLAVLFGCINVSFARTTLVATLQHGGQFTQYYGTNALTSAYNDAVEGDIITLSPGEFTFSGKFEKGITLRGTGIETSHDTYDAAKPYLTHITSSMKFYSKDSNSVTIVEGIRFTNEVDIYNTSSDKGQGTIKFIKNSFTNYSLYARSDFNEMPSNSPVVRFYNNLLKEVVFQAYSNPDFKFYNCYVEGVSRSSLTGFTDNPSAFYNCIFKYYEHNQGYPDYWKSSVWGEAYYLTFYNCIFYDSSKYTGALPTTASCSNCLSINNSSLFSSIFFNQDNKTTSDVADVFQTYTGNSWHETFALTETAKTSYIDFDGTEIGMQGGLYPFNLKVQYPVITTLTSDAQTTKEGKLNVTIEVDGK